MKKSNRRDFLKNAALGSAAAGIAAGTGITPQKVYSGETSDFQRVVYRELGSTGCKVSEMGFGVLSNVELYIKK